MNILINWILGAVTVFAASYVLPGIHVQNFATALIAALVIGVINAFLKPVLAILTLPITIITLGVFSFILNGFLIMVADYLVPGFKVDGFFWAFILSLILTIVGSIYHNINSSDEQPLHFHNT